VWWLEGRFHFSFADYYNKENISFGTLRVLNDDVVKPGGSFGSFNPPKSPAFALFCRRLFLLPPSFLAILFAGALQR
jgi:hypothetical protein